MNEFFSIEQGIYESERKTRHMHTILKQNMLSKANRPPVTNANDSLTPALHQPYKLPRI
jgi:hypothetical protein